jgi:hypothetical protein
MLAAPLDLSRSVAEPGEPPVPVALYAQCGSPPEP